MHTTEYDISLIILAESVYSLVEKISSESILDTFNFLTAFEKVYKEEESKLPFHLNLIEIAIRQQKLYEPTHSIYLCKLLQYKIGNTYPILEAFFNTLNITQHIVHPLIEAEKDKIDISILDENYAIIIENKINDASDQPEQIKRYIEKVKNKGYTNEQIYIIYIKGQLRNNPTEESLPSVLREQFTKNGKYFPITFKDEIIEWLDSINILNYNDLYLSSSLFQYRDFLKSCYLKNEIKKAMDSKIKKVILTELCEKRGIDEGNTEKLIEEVSSMIEKMDQSINYLEEIKKNAIQSAFNKAADELDIYDIKRNVDYGEITIDLKYQGKKFTLGAYFCLNEEEPPYIGFSHAYKCRNKATEDFIKSNFISNGWRLDKTNDESWYRWKYTTYEDITKDFIDAYLKIKDKLNK